MTPLMDWRETGRYMLQIPIGRRYELRNRTLCYRAWWFGTWQPVQIRKVATPWSISQEVIDDELAQREP